MSVALRLSSANLLLISLRCAPIILGIAALATLGIVSIYADNEIDGQKQLFFMLIGIGLLLGLQLVSYATIGRLAWVFYLLSLAALFYTVMPGVPSSGLFGVPTVNGARAWIEFGIMRFQPAEVTKIAFVLVLARYLRYRENYRRLPGLIPPFLLALFPLAMILKQPDLGTALVFIPALLIMLFVAGARVTHLAAIIGTAILAAPALWLSGQPGVPGFQHMPSLVKEYQRARVYAMFSSDPGMLQRTGFQQHNALIALGSGGVTGKGAGNIIVGKRVPERHNDMIFALIGEQFGLFGITIMLGAYVMIFFAGIEIAGSTKDPSGRLVAVGLVTLLAGQTFLNMAVALKLFPVTGVTLPFVSYGGSSLLASMTAAALLINISLHRPIIMGKDMFEGDL